MIINWSAQWCFVLNTEVRYTKTSLHYFELRLSQIQLRK